MTALYRILVMENNEVAQLDLKNAVERAVPDATVDAVPSAHEARALVDQAKTTGQSYHAAILDFSVPDREAGTRDVIDESVCQALGWAPNMLVLHPTLYVDHPQVIKHLAAYHSMPTSPSGDVIDKANYDWVEVTANEVRRYIYSNSIQRRLGTIFGAAESTAWGAPGAAFRDSGYTGRDTSLTYAMMDLTEDIAEQYHYVDEPTRRNINRHFFIEETPEGAGKGHVIVRLTEP